MISTVEKVLFLKSVGLFRQIRGEELARVALIATELDFGPGEVLMHEGELGESMYLIVDGQVDVIKGQITIAVLGHRESVGEMAVLDSEPRSATVRAKTATRVLRISKEDFYELLDERHEIARAIIKVLSQRLRLTTEKGSVSTKSEPSSPRKS